jgi:hypothetical protein
LKEDYIRPVVQPFGKEAKWHRLVAGENRRVGKPSIYRHSGRLCICVPEAIRPPREDTLLFRSSLYFGKLVLPPGIGFLVGISSSRRLNWKEVERHNL